MIKNKVPLLILLLFGDLFASCFYDDADNCNSFEKKDAVLAIYDSVKEYTSDNDKTELFYLNDIVRV